MSLVSFLVGLRTYQHPCTCICPSFDKVSVIYVVFLECCITFGKSNILVIHCNIAIRLNLICMNHERR